MGAHRRARARADRRRSASASSSSRASGACVEAELVGGGRSPARAARRRPAPRVRQESDAAARATTLRRELAEARRDCARPVRRPPSSAPSPTRRTPPPVPPRASATTCGARRARGGAARGARAARSPSARGFRRRPARSPSSGERLALSLLDVPPGEERAVAAALGRLASAIVADDPARALALLEQARAAAGLGSLVVLVGRDPRALVESLPVVEREVLLDSSGPRGDPRGPRLGSASRRALVRGRDGRGRAARARGPPPRGRGGGRQVERGGG